MQSRRTGAVKVRPVYPRACGGTLSRVENRREPSTVYPRACGGTVDPYGRLGLSPRVRGNPCKVINRLCNKGLSPRVRGNLLAVRFRSKRIGSIPARAGEPQNDLGRSTGVYPRACGGTSTPARSCAVQGRSIPARAGEPSGLRIRVAQMRSIPARAGEP